MPDKELLERVEDRLVTEETAYLDVMEHGSSIGVLHNAQRMLMQELQEVGASGDLETILLAEVLILKNERRLYADKRVMKSSLDNALNEIEAAMLLVSQVKDPAAYKSVADVYFHSHKVQIRGLPNDGARLFFKSHDSRLTDLEKARLMGIDKELIGVRKTNLKKAWTNYIELQKNALVTPETGSYLKESRGSRKAAQGIRPVQNHRGSRVR